MSLFQLHLFFEAEGEEEEAIVSIEGAVQIRDSAGSASKFSYSVAGVALMHSLISHEVTLIWWEEDGTVEMTFANGETLTLFDENGCFESYQIYYKDQIIIV